MDHSDARAEINPELAAKGRMFIGTFDDAVSRYPWRGVRTTSSTVTNTLIYHALMGPRLCSRIGNIIYFQEYFDGYTKGYTPIRELSKTGFFQFHMKGESFNDSIQRRVHIGTNSTLEWVEQTGWAKGSDSYRLLEELFSEAGSVGAKQYSPSFNSAFQVLADQVTAEGTPEYRLIHDKWTTAFGETLNRTRSEFEKLCDAEFGPDTPETSAAMSTINSVNHYAYGLGLHGSSDEIPVIETNELKSLNRLTKSLVDSGGQLEADHIAQLIESRVFDFVYKNLRFPVDLLHSPESWPKLARFVGVDQDESSEFMTLKTGFVRAVRNTLRGEDGQGLDKASREYSRFLCLEFGTPTSSLANFSASIGLDKLSTQAKKDAPGAALGEIMGQAAGLPPTTGSLAAFGMQSFLNLHMDIVYEKTSYHARRIIDRLRAKGLKWEEYTDHFVPMQNALCVKEITHEAGEAARSERLVELLEDKESDLF